MTTLAPMPFTGRYNPRPTYAGNEMYSQMPYPMPSPTPYPTYPSRPPMGPGKGGRRRFPSYNNPLMGPQGQLAPVYGGGMGQVIPTNIPFRDPGYGAPVRTQNLIQSLSGPNSLMDPYRAQQSMGMLDRFRQRPDASIPYPMPSPYPSPYPPVYGPGGPGFPPRTGPGKGGRMPPVGFPGFPTTPPVDSGTDDETTPPITTTPPVGGFNNLEDWAASLGEGQGGYRTSFVNPQLFIARSPDGTLKRFESETDAQNWAGSQTNTGRTRDFQDSNNNGIDDRDEANVATGGNQGEGFDLSDLGNNPEDTFNTTTDPGTTTNDSYQNYLNNLTDQQRRNLQFQAQQSTMGNLEGGIASLANISPMARQYIQAEADRQNALMNYSSSLSPEQRFARSTALDNMARRYAREQEGLMPIERRGLEDSQRQRLNELIEFYQGRGG